MKRQKKKGSSLITIVILMMFLTIIGTSAITTTMADYRFRINESKRIENLYGAESGLEVAKDLLLKIYEYSLLEALETTNSQTGKTYQELNEIFQNKMIDVLTNETYKDSAVILIDYALNQAINEKFYPEMVEGALVFTKPIVFEHEEKDLKIKTTPLIAADKQSVEFMFKSTFLSTDTNSQVSENERVITKSYTVTIPKYLQGSSEVSELVTIEKFPVFNQRLINVDGNALMTGKIDMNGNIQTKGLDTLNLTDLSYGKYAEGVKVKDAKVNLIGDLITNQTVILANKVDLIIDGDVYARNLYLGRVKNKQTLAVEESKAVNLKVSNDVIVENDLTVNVDSELLNQEPVLHSTATIQRFYGISDKNFELFDINNASVLAKKSSSIIVNNIGANVTINEEAYIGGVAYIDVVGNEKYETGESVAVKPNYLAYTTVIPGFEDRVTLKYYDPLMLIETISPEDGTVANDKANYFVKSETEKKLGGVTLPTDTYSAGATLTQTDKEVQAHQPNIPNSEFTSKVNTLRKDYATNVFNMGHELSYDSKCLNDVDPTVVNSCVKRTVANQINWDALAFSKGISDFNGNYGEVILNNNATITLIIEPNATGGHQISYSNDTPSVNVSKKALVITKGNVVLKGNVNLTGNIIATGDIALEGPTQGENPMVLINDGDITEKIIAVNYDLLEPVFNVDDLSYETVRKEVVTETITDPSTSDDYKMSLKEGIWKLEK